MADLHQDINRVSSFSRCLNGTFPWRNGFVNTACQNKGPSSGHQSQKIQKSFYGWLGWMVEPPSAQKKLGRTHRPAWAAPVRCQNRLNFAKWSPPKSYKYFTFNHFPVMVGQLWPKCLGKTIIGNVAPTRSKKKGRENSKISIFTLWKWILKVPQNHTNI